MEKIVLEPWMEEILNEYYKDGGKKLHGIIDRLFGKKYGGINNKDMDEFYSVANDVIVDICKHNRYDPSKGEFGGFLYGALDMAIIDEFKRQTRDKRVTKIEIEEKDTIGNIVKKRVSIHDVYMDAPIGEDGTGTMKDLLESDFNLEKKSVIRFNAKVNDYLNSLSKMQRKIAEMLIAGYVPSEIRKYLQISEKKYARYLSGMNISEKRMLLKNNECINYEEDKPMQVQTQTSEKSKQKQYSISSLNKKYESYTFKFDHPIQRKSGRWNTKMKGNLISDVLQDNPLPDLVFAEKIIDGISVTYNLDGKQKCTNIYDFSVDAFRISRNITRPIIKYQTPVVDEDGKVILNGNGLPEKLEQKEFDIRGKKYSDLPNELKERFNDYTFRCVYYLNCTDEDIEYHIRRYNEGIPMSQPEKGMSTIGTRYAAHVKEIASMSFFMDCGEYKTSEFRNGTIERVVIESIMSSNFINDWKKKQEDMCTYIRNNATDEDFECFEELIDRLEKVSTERISELFNSKDSFLWFGLFARFNNSGLDDNRFVDFLNAFIETLRGKKIDDESFNDILERTTSTKDKNVVLNKMNHLEQLMNEFLHIENEEITESSEDIDVKEFIEENVGISVEDRDVDFSEAILEDLILNVDNNSKLLEESNMVSMLAIVAYSCEIDFDLDNWIIDYFQKNKEHIANQKQNYLHMKKDLDNYIEATKDAKEQKTA